VGRLDLSGYRLRQGVPGDLDGILALEQASFPPEDRFPRRSWHGLLASHSVVCLVVVDPSVIASVAWLLRCTSALAVHPDARGRGLARRLVAESLRRLPSRIDTLGLEVRSDNQAAVGLYCALGFIESARLPDYYGPGRSGLRMRASLSAVREALSRTG